MLQAAFRVTLDGGNEDVVEAGKVVLHQTGSDTRLRRERPIGDAWIALFEHHLLDAVEKHFTGLRRLRAHAPHRCRHDCSVLSVTPILLYTRSLYTRIVLNDGTTGGQLEENDDRRHRFRNASTRRAIPTGSHRNPG